ncbi:hypothetical protein O7A60_24300 [Mesorhizobium sp. Ld1326N3]|uniref:DNA ligase (ATP) n=1 Tax=Mesorhizobium salmacidum TaxID=3015171 RepID=A0ABU8L381_9HYPH
MSDPVNKPKATWVRPDVLAEVQFSGVTDRGILREAVFKSQREDLVPISGKPAGVLAATGGEQGPWRPRRTFCNCCPMQSRQDELVRYWQRVADQAPRSCKKKEGRTKWRPRNVRTCNGLHFAAAARS